jgi:hypothetical protein
MHNNLLQRFNQSQNKYQVYIDRYQYFLSIAATFLFFSNLPDYLQAAPIWPVIPLVWIIVFAILSIPFIKKVASIPKPLLAWTILYIFISALSLITVSGDEISFTDFRAKCLSVLFLALMYAIYDQKSLTHIKYTIVVVLFLSVGTNLIELMHPRIFSALSTGRPAGFYINPNASGCALILEMLLGMSVIKKPYRWMIVMITGIGVVSTFSRGAILGWLICVSILIGARMLSDRRRQAILPAIILLLLLVFLNPLQTFSGYYKGDINSDSWDIVNRLEEFQNPSLNEDSAMERQLVAASSWELFSKNPFWGNGLASTRKWSISEVSTHNMYLYYMADHGIIGVLFLPGAILCVVYGNRGEHRSILICFAVFMSLWGVFSHEVLAERYILSAFALFAAISTNQRWYLRYANGNVLMAPPLESTDLRLPEPRKKTTFLRNLDR